MEHPINSTHPLEKMNQLAQTHLDLKQWGFLEAARFDKKFPVIIFRSEWCLVRFTWARQEASGENIINIHYGRLHAAFDNSYLMWNGEKCHCWHDIVYVLHFLDGYSPDEVAGKNYRRPAIMEQYRQSEV